MLLNPFHSHLIYLSTKPENGQRREFVRLICASNIIKYLCNLDGGNGCFASCAAELNHLAETDRHQWVGLGISRSVSDFYSLYTHIYTRTHTRTLLNYSFF